MSSPHLCLHANEVPQSCPCEEGCYCREAGNTCNRLTPKEGVELYANVHDEAVSMKTPLKHAAIEVMRKWVELFDKGELVVLESMQHKDFDQDFHPTEDLVRMRASGGMKLAISVEVRPEEWGEWFKPARLTTEKP